MSGVGVQVVGAAAQQEQLERLLGKAFGRRARRKRPVSPVGLALARAMGDGNARVGVPAQKAHKGRSPQVHPFQGFGAVNRFQQRKLREQ
jgi:hypothetical protein